MVGRIDCTVAEALQTEGGDFTLSNGELEHDSKVLDQIYTDILSRYARTHLAMGQSDDAAGTKQWDTWQVL